VAQRRESVRRLESLRTDMRTACDAYCAVAQRGGSLTSRPRPDRYLRVFVLSRSPDVRFRTQDPW